MSTDPCSVKSYVEGQESGSFQSNREKVLQLFDTYKRMTGEECRQRFHEQFEDSPESENVRNRITELTHMGFLRKVGTTKGATDATVNIWERTSLPSNSPMITGKVVRPKKVPVDLFDAVLVTLNDAENFAISAGNPALRAGIKDIVTQLKQL